MLTLRGMKHIRTGRNIKSFRSCPHATGVPMSHLDVERIARGEERMAGAEAWRAWLDNEWSESLKRRARARPLPIPPASARS